MSNHSLVMQEFHHQTASMEDWAALNIFANRCQVEVEPDDPPVPLEAFIRINKSVPQDMNQRHTIVKRNERGEVVAWAVINKKLVATLQLQAIFHIRVLPDYRLQGIGTSLLAQIMGITRQEQYQLLSTLVPDCIPASTQFLKLIGGREEINWSQNQLDLSDLNYACVQKWLEYAQTLDADFELGCWDHPVPEADLNRCAEIMTAASAGNPADNHQREAPRVTPESIRRFETFLTKSSKEIWTINVREQATGQIVGLTQVFWDPATPELLMQGGTAVLEQYRNRGLGRWIKAAMVEKVLRERPQVRRICTSNAVTNAPMLKINTELGFKLHNRHTQWEVTPEGIEAYLASRIPVLRLS